MINSNFSCNTHNTVTLQVTVTKPQDTNAYKLSTTIFYVYIVEDSLENAVRDYYRFFYNVPEMSSQKKTNT